MVKRKAGKKDNGSEFLTNTIVVKLHDELIIPDNSNTGVSKYLSEQFGPSTKDMLKKYKETAFGKSITSITPTQIDKMVAEAKEKSITSSTPTQIDKMVAESKEKSDLLQENYSPPNFHNFLKIKCKSTTPKFELLKLIQSEKIVEYAYIRGRSFPGSEPQITESFTRRQRYLKAAPVGINAKFARQNGGDGKGNFRFIDIEDGWSHLNQAHPDLPNGTNNSTAIRLLSGLNAGSREHGNEVLGIILAQDNGFGITGITPFVQADVVSEYFSNRSSDPDPANAIAFANDQLQSGDIMLITLQNFDQAGNILPVEKEPDVFHQIHLGTMKGIIIVEIAGNGGVDLDAYPGNNGSPRDHIFDRSIRDSGAIMVGSAKSRRPHNKFATSNFGSRVDCYAWGEKITTTDDSGYIFNFGQTSGAGAIIAGSAISVQGMHLAKNGSKLDCAGMRAMLSQRANGTSSGDLIGVMPDLKQIAINMGVAPGV